MKTLFTVILRSIMALAITLETVSAAPSFSKVIGPSDPMPDGPGLVRQILEPVLDEASSGGTVLVNLINGFDPGSYGALYLVDADNNFQTVVSTETPAPRGMVFRGFSRLAVYDGMVYFLGSTDAGLMLCKVEEPGGPVTLIIATGDEVEPGTGKVLENIGSISVGPEGMVFDGAINQANIFFYRDLFYYGGETPVSLLGYGTTFTPDGTGFVFGIGSGIDLRPVIRGDVIAFFGWGVPPGPFFGSVSGLYTFPVPGSAKAPASIVNDRMATPSSAELFLLPGDSFTSRRVFDFDEGRAVFYGLPSGVPVSGYYRSTIGNGTTLAVDGATAVPGGTGNFYMFDAANYEISLSGERMVFRGTDDASFNTGLYLHTGETVEKIIAAGDEIDGVQINQIEMFRDGLVGDNLVFLGNFALYRASLVDEVAQPVSLGIRRNGTGVEVFWDAAAVGAVLYSTGSLSDPDWQPVDAQTNPFPAQPQTDAPQYFRLQL